MTYMSFVCISSYNIVSLISEILPPGVLLLSTQMGTEDTLLIGTVLSVPNDKFVYLKQDTRWENL